MKNVIATLNRTVLLILFFCNNIFAQENPEWVDLSDELPPGSYIGQMEFDSNGDMWMIWPLTQYDGENWIVHQDTAFGHELNNVSSFVIDSQDNIWIGCAEEDGLVRYDGENWTYFDLCNWGLPYNVVYSLAVDQEDAIWIGTAMGLVKFDGNIWTVYDTSNSPIPSTEAVYSLAIDNDNVKWMGFGGWQYGTILSFDDTSWTAYNEGNTGANLGDVRSLNIDNSGNKWFTIGGGSLNMLDNYICTTYDHQNSGLPEDGIPCLTVDYQDNIWIGTGGQGGMGGLWGSGLVRFDGINWTVFDTSNSDIPDNYVSSIICDDYGNIWIATLDTESLVGLPAGLAVFQEGGVILGIGDEPDESNGIIAKDFVLKQNYPNPFNPVTTIRYDLPEQSHVNVDVYDLLGKHIRMLVHQVDEPGNKSVIWDARDDFGNPVGAGMYLYRIRVEDPDGIGAGDFVQTKKMILLK